MTDRTTQARAMLTAHESGATLEAIAAEHGVSTRTVRRRLADLKAAPAMKPDGPDVHVSEEARTGDMWRRSVEGWTQTQIGEHYGISQPAVSERLSRYRRALPETPRETVFQRELDRLDALMRPLLDLVNGRPPPAYSNGRAMKDENGELVPDYSVMLSAVDRVVKVQDRLAKMLGLDAPARAEVHVEAVTDAARQAAERAKAFLADASMN